MKKTLSLIILSFLLFSPLKSLEASEPRRHYGKSYGNKYYGNWHRGNKYYGKNRYNRHHHAHRNRHHRRRNLVPYYIPINHHIGHRRFHNRRFGRHLRHYRRFHRPAISVDLGGLFFTY